MTPVTDPEILSQLNAQAAPQPQLKGVRDPKTLAALEYDIDLSANPREIRNRIEKLPETEKKRAHDIWADYRVAAKGYTPLPSPAKGIPILGSYLDEAVGGINAGLHSLTNGAVGAPYDEAVAKERALDRATQAKYPVLNPIVHLASGIATGGPIFSRLGPAATLTGRVGQGAVVGGIVGAIEGYGAGEGDDRLASAVSGAKWGAGVGGGIPIGAAAGSRAFGWAADRISPEITRMRFGPEASAEEILAQRIAREGSSPAAKRLDLQRGQSHDARLAANSNATLPETLADTSDAMRRLTGSVYRAGGEAGNEVRDALVSRQRGSDNLYGRTPAGSPDGQMARVMDATERALLIRSSGSAYRTEQQIMQQQAQEGRRLYAAACQNSEPFNLQPALDAMSLTAMNYPGQFRQRLLRALGLFRDESPQRFAVSNIERFDAAKKSLDDMIETAQRQGQGNLGRELTKFKRSLLDAVHAPQQAGGPARNQAYQEARNAWGSAAENRYALELGRAALRQGSEITADQFRALSAGQQQLFRLSFVESVRNALGGKRPGQDVTQLFEQRRVRDLMQEIIPRSRNGNAVFADRPERFGGLIGREQRMVQTNNTVLGNSATAQRQADDAAFAGDALASMWSRFRSAPSLFNMGIEAVGVGIQRVFGYRQDVATALARRLLETDPTARNALLRRLQAQSGPDVFSRFADQIDRSATAITASTAGPLQTQQDDGRRR